MRILFILLFLLGISSCAFNKLFLVPMPLRLEDMHTRYSDKYGDTLTMAFKADSTPIVYYSDHSEVEFPYIIESKHFDSESGNKIHCWHFTPKEVPFNGTTILFLHGNAGHLAYQYGLVTPFVEAGYEVIMPDYSGFGFSEGKATRKNVLLDGLTSVDFAKSIRSPESKRFVVYGQSLGGHLSGVVASLKQDEIDALVMEGAFYSHSSIAGNMVPILGQLFTREMYSSKRSLPEYHKPILIIHSTEDQTIPYKYGVKLFEAANEPKELYTIDKPHVRGPLYYLDSITKKMDALTH